VSEPFIPTDVNASTMYVHIVITWRHNTVIDTATDQYELVLSRSIVMNIATEQTTPTKINKDHFY
jgi:hypothetical protein